MGAVRTDRLFTFVEFILRKPQRPKDLTASDAVTATVAKLVLTHHRICVTLAAVVSQLKR